jgi:hypothetical protein
MSGYVSSDNLEHDDGILIKTDSTGSLEWSDRYGGAGEEVLFYTKQLSDTGYIACGQTSSFEARNEAVYLIKTDQRGRSDCNYKQLELNAVQTEVQEISVDLPFENPVYILKVGSYSEEYTSNSLCNYQGFTQENNFPKSIKLNQNYPNPFNPTTTIEYSIPRTSQVTIKVYKINGQEVRSLLVNKNSIPGNYKVEWDGRDNHGHAVASGSYFYQLESEGLLQARKMIHVK